MDPISDGCRLCLDPFAEKFTTIESPELKDQMEKVFYFTIESKQGCYSGVCQNCSYAISEFYQYSEKVRRNQELLNGNATNIDPIIDCKVSFETVKVEMLSDSELQKSTEEVIEPKGEIPEKKDPSSGDDDSYEPPPKKLQSKRKGRPRKPKTEDSNSEADESTKNSKKANLKTQEERDKEDQLFNNHFRMICDLCGTTASTFKLLRSHFWKEHKRRDGYVVCCKKKLSKRYAILNHIHYHANPDAFRCEVCSKSYKNKETLDAHMLNSHSSEDQRPFKCDHCSQSFGQKCALAVHMERHHHQKIMCLECKKLFATKSSLGAHMANQHSGKDRTIVCDTCGQEFLSKQCFERHMNEHKGIEVQRLQCNICQRWLKGKRNFQNHMDWVHADGDRAFQCDICLQKYPHSRALQCHKLQTHVEAKHECEFCGKKFKKALALKEHRTTHTGEVLYSCEFCGVPNNCMANLYKHFKQQHPAEWAQKKLKTAQGSGLP